LHWSTLCDYDARPPERAKKMTRCALKPFFFSDVSNRRGRVITPPPPPPPPHTHTLVRTAHAEMSEEKTYTGRCYCGAVKVTAVGEPAAVAVCHCRDCSRWGGINMASLWPCEKVTVEGDLVEFTNPPPEGKPKGSNRKTCAKCRSNVLNDHPDTMKLTDVVSGIMDGYEFKPKMHINYSEAIWKVKDGLPKFATMPAAFGGDDKMLEE